MHHTHTYSHTNTHTAHKHTHTLTQTHTAHKTHHLTQTRHTGLTHLIPPPPPLKRYLQYNKPCHMYATHTNLAASISGVQPALFWCSMFEWFLSNSSTTFLWPFQQAKVSGMLFSLPDGTFTWAPWSSNSSATVKCPSLQTNQCYKPWSGNRQPNAINVDQGDKKNQIYLTGNHLFNIAK